MPRPHPALIAFAREFNAGRYFEAHEALEESLETLPEEFWDLYVGLIQVAVGYHKRSQGLRQGSIAMLGRGLEKLRAFPNNAAGIDLADLGSRVSADVKRYEQPASIIESDPLASPPRIRFLRHDGSPLR